MGLIPHHLFVFYLYLVNRIELENFLMAKFSVLYVSLIHILSITKFYDYIIYQYKSLIKAHYHDFIINTSDNLVV